MDKNFEVPKIKQMMLLEWPHLELLIEDKMWNGMHSQTFGVIIPMSQPIFRGVTVFCTEDMIWGMIHYMDREHNYVKPSKVKRAGIANLTEKDVFALIKQVKNEG